MDVAYGLKDDGEKFKARAWSFASSSSCSESDPAREERDLEGDKSRSSAEWLTLMA